MSLSEISIHFNESTLDEIIRKAGGEKHTRWSFGDGTIKGDSYLSDQYRLKVEGVDKTNNPIEIDLFVKSMPKNLGHRSLFRAADFFQHEVNFYNKVIPAFEDFQKRKNATDPFIEFPNCPVAYADGSKDFIAMEDVSCLGYATPSRQEGVDYEHCSFIMKSLGRFHAVSLAIKDQEPKLFEKLIAEGTEDAISVAIDAVEKEYPGTVYEEKTKKFLQNDLYTDQINIVNTRTMFSVIGHGDCWTPNFLIQYENIDGIKKPKLAKIIDFQLTRYASPAVDISFFFYSCTSQELRTKYYEQLIETYHSNACALLKDLGSDPEKIFPIAALKDELKNFGRFGCGMGIESVPLSIMDADDVPNLDEIKTNAILTDVWKIGPIKNKENRLRLASIFKHAIDQGYL